MFLFVFPADTYQSLVISVKEKKASLAWVVCGRAERYVADGKLAVPKAQPGRSVP
jgi:hypothetical protein